MSKYTIEELIAKKIIFVGNFMQAKSIAKVLKEVYGINTEVIDEMFCIRDPKFRMSIDHNDLVLFYDDNAVEILKKTYLIISCDEIDIEYPTDEDIKESNEKSFELNEIVHVYLKANEPFNLFARDEHVTGIISAIDNENRMCEVVHLRNRHNAVWLSFNDIFHIEHTYDEFEIDEIVESCECDD